MDYALEISGVSKKLNKFELSNVSINLPKGMIMGLVGHNGAGKTTLIKLILNMLRPNSGDIKIFGKDNLENEIIVKEKIGVVMDSLFYVKDWTVGDVGKALKPFYKQWDSVQFYKMLSDFTIDPKKKVKELSRGMQMKLMITCALSHNADLLILDEPTNGLDPVARNELAEILRAFVLDKNRSILFSTHITADLEKIADYITFINKGKIIYTDKKEDLLKKYVLIKGELGVLSSRQKHLVIGYQENKEDFEGVILKKEIDNLPKTLIIKPCNLDELVIKFNIGI